MKYWVWGLLLGLFAALPAAAESVNSSDFLNRLEQIANLPVYIIFLSLVVSTYVSEDLTCAMAGILVAQGHFGMLPAIVACICGIFTGDLLLVVAGRFINRKLLHRPPLNRWIKIRKIKAAEAWFKKRGPFAVFISRFIPGTRFPTYLTAGMLHMPFRQFTLYFLSASIIWTPFLVITSAKLGEQVLPLMDQYAKAAPLILVGLVLTLLILFKLIFPLVTHTGRRMFIGRWKRVIHWEFWPPWIFYLPMIPVWVKLMIQFKSPTVFTAANPMLEDGGFINESKADILNRLDANDPEWLPWGLLSTENRKQRFHEFMERHQLTYPVVLKPDRGQRGAGVHIVKNEAQTSLILNRYSVDLIVQAFATGVEYGVFYLRHPDEPQGQIFSITEKRMLHVTGDGERTLKQLILDDPRAVCMYNYLYDQWAEELYTIPPAKEVIQLTELGTHCKGALFLDGERLNSSALLTRIDEISQKVDGFYFGRYDIRCPSEEDFVQGRNLRIVELNGVTSEATHIYDPTTSLFDAYRVLSTQWQHAFSIGQKNHLRGHPVMGLRTLWNRIRNYQPPEEEMSS